MIAGIPWEGWVILACGMIGFSPIWWIVNRIVKYLDNRDARRENQ